MHTEARTHKEGETPPGNTAAKRRAFTARLEHATCEFEQIVSRCRAAVNGVLLGQTFVLLYVRLRS